MPETIKRVTRDHTIGPERRYRVREPVQEVDLCETFVVETINFRTPIIRTPEDANPATFREREETGPIYVNGVQPGDVLAIHIEGIKPVGHASGGWWETPDVNAFLEIAEGRVHFPGGLWAPLRMMIGDIYVTPRQEDTPNPWDNGGNMDFKDVSMGNVLCLKPQLEGGLLVLGDAHAVQGDGEILGLGAECAADVTLRITREKRFLSERPLLRTPEGFVALASRFDYGEARDLAARDAAKVLARVAGCAEEEAYLYVTTVGDLRNGGVWSLGREEDVPPTVGLEVPVAEAWLAQGD
jgi:amidase